MHRRIETYIVLGMYFAMGLVFGYIIGKDSGKKDYLNTKINQIKSGGNLCEQNLNRDSYYLE